MCSMHPIVFTPFTSMELDKSWSLAHYTHGHHVVLCAESMYNILWRIGSNSEAYFSFDIHICNEILKKILLNGVTAHLINGVVKLIIVDNSKIKGKYKFI